MCVSAGGTVGQICVRNTTQNSVGIRETREVISALVKSSFTNKTVVLSAAVGHTIVDDGEHHTFA
jgi:hypothetical protein